MRPKSSPTFNPNDERYWDPIDLGQELERVFSVCHGCRMCVHYCPAFPELFERVDGYVDQNKGEIEAFTADDYKAVNDLCYQCKLCYFKCPYTPDDQHAFQLDFPRLMLRHKAVRAKREGVSVQDTVLGEPQAIGKIGSGLTAPVANLVSKNRLLRKIQEKTTGISAQFNLPPFANESFFTWYKKRSPQVTRSSEKRVALFATCTASYNMTAAAIAATQVLEHNGYEVVVPLEQQCCGMPNLDGGDTKAAIAKATKNVEAFLPWAKQGVQIVVPGPTCSYMLKKEYPELLDHSPEATLVATHTLDLMEFLRLRLREKTLNKEFKHTLGTVAYHASCHLRAQKIGSPAMQVLEAIELTEFISVEQCSAVDGTWGMKAQYYELGLQYAQKLIRELGQIASPNFVATDCPLSALRLEKELGTKIHHPVELLNYAYGLPDPHN
ncbi:MAG: 4Fe-4S dicluster domain-containing protein [Myxococcales bacterium]|nr:MAG: 4Fe-4S dicluster domain-containing protein [Myxococcales bacterium]